MFNLFKKRCEHDFYLASETVYYANNCPVYTTTEKDKRVKTFICWKCGEIKQESEE